MDILLVVSAFHSLSQRVYAELSDLEHRVDVVLASHGPDAVRAAVREVNPELIIAPMLRTALPEDVCQEHTCLVVHPGPPGDRGPDCLDRAIAEEAPSWGVTVLRAGTARDAGDIWAEESFALSPVGKSDLYRGEVSDAASAAVLRAVQRYAEGAYKPRSQDGPGTEVVPRDCFGQERRRIDWERDSTRTVLRKLRGADSRPGVLDELLGHEVYLHGGHPEDRLRGRPGELLATRAGAICRATVDGAVWIPELRPRKSSGDPAPFRRPAASVLEDLASPPGAAPARNGAVGPAHRLPEINVPLELSPERQTWADIRYRQHGDTGFLSFGFPGGAMSTEHCRRLLATYRYALTRRTSVLVLGGGRDFSTGLHLNVIEAAADPAEETWANLDAMDDLVEAVLRTTDRLVVAAVGGNAAAGGLMLALAADEVWCREGAVLNPHYRRTGLYGSEFWTYTLPRRVGARTAQKLTDEALPMTAAHAARIGLADRLLPVAAQEFTAATDSAAADLAGAPDLAERITAKAAARRTDENERPLSEYRRDELARMRAPVFDPRSDYHALRSATVRNLPTPSARPLTPFPEDAR